MAGVLSGTGTTFGLPNFGGELIALTPAETPMLAAIGGLTGGEETNSTRFEWQTYDLRTPSGQNVALEGAAAPTAQNRVRGNVDNVVEVHQSTVSVTYTKQAATQQKSGVNNGQTNPVTDELAFQTTAELKSIGMDIEYSFLHGKKQIPSDNTTPRKTRGLIEAITTEGGTVSGKARAVVTDATSATDTITKATHGFAVDDQLVFTATDVATGISTLGLYWVVNVGSASTFKVSATKGGAPITLGTASNIGYRALRTAALTYDELGEFAQGIYDNGGLRGGQPTFIVGASQKRAISAALRDLGAKAAPVQGNVGGVVVDIVETDLGRFNIMLHPRMIRDAIIATSLDELAPVFLNIPGKGFLFLEELGKKGASEDYQLYGEVGLKYGAAQHHGILTGLKA